MATEYERKFRATPADLTAIEETLSGQTKKISMETTYYDTPSGQLSACQYTLRRRLENGDSVCTLKTPAGDARCEWETVCEEIEAAIPVLITMGAPEALAELTQEGVIPICGARFTRLAKTIVLEEAVAELALDHGYLFSGGQKAPLCEVEVELKSGDKESFDRYVRSFAKAFSLEEEPESKFCRALRLWLYRGE